MLSMLKNIKNKLFIFLKRRQFDRNSILGEETKFDFLSGCRNESYNPENIKIGNNCMIQGLVPTTGYGKVIIGDRLYMGGGSHIGAVESIVIGNDVIIAGNTHIYDDNNHLTEPELRLKMSRSGDFFGELWSWAKAEHKPITIEDNVWIGERCAIFKGVRIGKGVIVG